jgi:hypothetical protein
MKYISKFGQFLNEQNDPRTVVVAKGTDTVTKAEFPKQKIGDSFPNRIPQGGTIEALYKSDVVKKNITDLKPKIEQFIKDNPEQTKFVLIISAGESQVTNPEQFKTPGSLALARANAVKDYVNEIFADLIKSGKITIAFPKTEADVKIGTTQYKGLTPQQRASNAEAYKAEQFVDIDLKGAGQKTIKGKDIVKTYCGKQINNGGKASLPQDGYTLKKVVKLGPGEGKISLSMEAYDVPDILYVEYNGKTYGSSNFFGASEGDFRVGIGTAMILGFETNDKIPPSWGDKKFMELDPENQTHLDTILEGIVKMSQWGLISSEEKPKAMPQDEETLSWGCFYNIFKHSKSSLKNDEIAQVMYDFDVRCARKIKRAERNAPQLVEDLKPLGMKWGVIETKMDGKSYYNFDINKIDGVDDITVINVAPCGATGWTVRLDCK